MQNAAETGNSSAQDQEEVKTTTLQEARQARINELSNRQSDESEENTEEEAEATEEEVEESAESEEAAGAEESEETEEETEESEEESDDVLSQINWDELDEDTKIAIAQQVGSGAAKRIGELSGKVKELEASLANKEKALEDGLGSVISPDNSFGSVTDLGKLDETEQSIERDIQYFDDWIADDENHTFTDGRGNEYARRDVHAHLKNLRSQLKDIPKQRQYLDKLSKAKESASSYSKKASEEFDWIHDESTPTFKKYDELVSDADIAFIEKLAPTVAAKLKYNLAHAAISMTNKAKKKIVLKTKKGKPVKAPESGAKTSSPNARNNKKLKDLQKRARSGDIQAARELRLAQITQRFKR